MVGLCMSSLGAVVARYDRDYLGGSLPFSKGLCSVSVRDYVWLNILDWMEGNNMSWLCKARKMED